MGQDAFPVVPDMPGTQFGGGLRIDSPDQPVFAKEIDLAFRMPQAAIDAASAAGRSPRDVAFYVLRRFQGPAGEVLFETIDYAKVEGEGAGAKVVTASQPFSGYTNSYGALDAAGGLIGVAASYVILMWAFDQAMPGRGTMGTITGLVQVVDPVTLTATPPPAQLAVVGVDASGNPLVGPGGAGQTFALTQSNGSYTLFDHHFTSGTVQVQTGYLGRLHRATVFAVAPDWALGVPAVQTLLQNPIFPAVGHANISMPAAPPPPPAPAITLRVFRTVDGAREDTRGLVVEDTPVQVGAKLSTPLASGESLSIAINGQHLSSTADPLQATAPHDPRTMDVVTSEDYAPAQVGTYTVLATITPRTGLPTTQALTFRVIAAGGGIDTDPAAAPAVLGARTLPRPGAIHVDTAAQVQLAFSEPVRNIPGHVRLLAPDDSPVEIRLSGVGIDAQGQAIVVEDVSSPAATVTSLTVTPREPLSLSTRYRLRGDIVDPSLTYLAEARVSRQGQAIRAYPRRLRLERTPLAINSYDRAFRIQFAIPEAAEAQDYAVQIFLAAPGSPFASNPTFTIDGTQIRNTPVSEEGWCPTAIPGSETSASWLLCRIDQMVRVPGTATDIRRQAFEIATVFAGYPKVRVVIRRPSDGVDLVAKEGVVTRDNDWAEVVTAAERRLAATAGIPVDVNGPLPPVVFEAARALGHLPALAYRVLAPSIWLREQFPDVPWKFLEGFAAGYWSAYDGDVAMLSHPIVAAQKAYADAKQFFTWLKDQPSGPAQAFALALRGYNYLTSDGRPEIVFDPVAFANTYAYASGYLMGVALEQLASGVIVAGATLGAGAVASKAVQAIAAARWVGVVAVQTAKLLKALHLFVQELAAVGAGEEKLRRAWGLVKGAGDAAVALFDYYPQPRALFRQSALAIKNGGEAVQPLVQEAWRWLTVVDRMTDEAAARLVRFVTEIPEARTWLTRLVGTGDAASELANGRKAVAAVFRAAKDGPPLPGEAVSLVASAVDATGSDLAAVRLIERYRPEELVGFEQQIQAKLQAKGVSGADAVKLKGQLAAVLGEIDAPPAKLMEIADLDVAKQQRMLDTLVRLERANEKRAVGGIFSWDGLRATHLDGVLQNLEFSLANGDNRFHPITTAGELLGMIGDYTDGPTGALRLREGLAGPNSVISRLAGTDANNAKGALGELLVGHRHPLAVANRNALRSFRHNVVDPETGELEVDLLFQAPDGFRLGGYRVDVKNVRSVATMDFADDLEKDIVFHLNELGAFEWRLVGDDLDRLRNGLPFLLAEMRKRLGPAGAFRERLGDETRADAVLRFIEANFSRMIIVGVP